MRRSRPFSSGRRGSDHLSDDDDEHAGLRFLARVVATEVDLLEQSAKRLLADVEIVIPSTVADWIADVDLSERLDAFVSRFMRLQDSLSQRLIPALLAGRGVSAGSAADNLRRAERLGWIDSAEAWQKHLKLPKQMIHEYNEDILALADALDDAHRRVPDLLRMARRVLTEVERVLKSG